LGPSPTYFRKCRYDEAISDCSKAIEIDPELALAYNNRGLAYYGKGEFDNAWEDFSKAESLGFRFPPRLIKDLYEVSGREI
jgi:tetratricopeptide (TPR) repeat protein